jgi:hypothetical protein
LETLRRELEALKPKGDFRLVCQVQDEGARQVLESLSCLGRSESGLRMSATKRGTDLGVEVEPQGLFARSSCQGARVLEQRVPALAGVLRLGLSIWGSPFLSGLGPDVPVDISEGVDSVLVRLASEDTGSLAVEIERRPEGSLLRRVAWAPDRARVEIDYQPLGSAQVPARLTYQSREAPTQHLVLHRCEVRPGGEPAPEAQRAEGGSIEDEVRTKQKELEGCYLRELEQNPGLAGRLLLHLTLDPTGRVTTAAVDEDSLRAPRVTDCLIAKAKAWRFSSAAGATELELPLRFAASN